MSYALALDSRAVVLDLHQLCRDLDPARWRVDLASAMRDRVGDLQARFSRVLAREPGPEPPRAPLARQLREVSELLQQRVPGEDLPAGELADAWARYRQQLVHAYEALSVSLRENTVRVPALRPTNYVRNAFHVASAVTAIVLLEEVLSDRQRGLVPLCIALSFWFLESLRTHVDAARRFLLWIFKPIAHPFERYRINSSTWFVSALTLLGVAFDARTCAVAVAVLGFGDPAAALIGRRWGRTRLIHGRSLEGTIAFVIAGTLAASLALIWWHGDMSWPLMLALAVSGAVSGAVAELFSRRVDDNFSIPMAAGVGTALATLAFG